MYTVYTCAKCSDQTAEDPNAGDSEKNFTKILKNSGLGIIAQMLHVGNIYLHFPFNVAIFHQV